MIYLDYAASSPLDPRVLEEMLPHLKESWGNPSSPHAMGRKARAAIDAARQTIADLFGIKAHEVIFTSSGSEANSLAILGRAEKWVEQNGSPGKILMLSIEHKCSLKSVDRLRKKGWDVVLLPVDEHGVLNPSDLEEALTIDTALVSIQWANNEVGTVQPIEEIAKLCTDAKVPFHCDAVQAVGQVPLSPEAPKERRGIPNLITIAAHKFGGPKGMGALIVREYVELTPLILGGGQEFGMRAGTENTPGIVGMAKALEIAFADQPTTFKHLTELREFFVTELLKIDGATINGHSDQFLPSIVNVRFAGKSGETLVAKLDMEGICCSTGSACATGATEPSHVLEAMGRSTAEAGENVRFSMSKTTTKEEITTVTETLKQIL